jgi:tetratricopeptide (TPR) repeat protein
MMLTWLELPNLHLWLDWGYDAETLRGDGKCMTAATMAALGNFYALADALRDDAAQRYRRALQSATRLHDRSGEANTIKALGDVHGAHGQLDAALKNFEVALQIFKSIGDAYSQAVTLGSLGELWLRYGRPEDGYRAWAQRMLLVIALEPGLAAQMSGRTINLARGHARVHPDQAAAGCAALLSELQPALERAQQDENEQSAFLLAVTLAAFQVIRLVAQALATAGDERQALLEQARTQAAQVGQATNNRFALAAWLDQATASP